MKLHLYILMFILLASILHAQDPYFTKNGQMLINTEVYGISASLKSNQLNVLLDYETSDISIMLDISTLETETDKIQENLKTLTNSTIKFDGNLGIDYINTKGHPKQEINIEGYFRCSDKKQYAQGKGVLEHLYSDGQYACMLTISIHLENNYLNCFNDTSTFFNDMHLEIFQAVLKHRSPHD